MYLGNTMSKNYSMPMSKITKLTIVNGKNPIDVVVGTAVFLGENHPRVPVPQCRCGHLISFDKDSGTCQMFSDGIRTAAKEFIEAAEASASSDSPITLKIFNSKALYLMESDTIDELVVGGF